MKHKCPHCNEPVDELRGACPHCDGDLNAEGLRALLLGNKSTMATALEDFKEWKKDFEGRLDSMDARQAEAEAKAKERALAIATGDKLDGGEDRPKPVDVGNVIRACVKKDWDGYDYEREVCEEGAERWRALSTQAVGSGGAIIPPEYLPQEMIELLRAKVVVEMLGARVLNNLMGSPVTIPRLAGGAVAYHVAENLAKTATDQSFEELSMVPHEVAAATIYSKRMALLSNPSVDMIIQEDLLKALALSIDYMAMFGSGAANEPVGILNTVGITAYTLNGDTGNGATPVAIDVDDMQYEVENVNSNMDRMGWAFNARSKNTFKKIRDEGGGAANTGRWLFRDDIKEGNLDGVPYGLSNQIPNNITKGSSSDCSYILLGDWADLILGYWGGLEIATSDQAGDTFLKNQVVIKAALLYDVALRHPETFVVADGVRP